VRFPTDVTPALGRLPIFYMCHPVAPRDGERKWYCECGYAKAAIVAPVCERCFTTIPSSIRSEPTNVAVVCENVRNARRWWRWLATWEAIAVIAPWMVNVEEWTIAGMTDETPESALVERGLRDDCAVVARLDGVIITNRAGRGSTMEGNAALAAGRVAYDLRHYGPMPPDGEPGSTAKLHPKDADWRWWLG
jgi:hypothetical protein